jgi:4-diphosphocytidyl-2C-methyl-D-erythritol 2-phosphate synthase
MPTKVRSHAKINLGLGIGAPRSDGFHALATVYQTIELHDVVTVSARLAAATAIRLTSNDERVPADNRNTAWKMVELALERMGCKAEVEIHIDKRLPVQGGLGAGSANAVAALVGLEAELDVFHGLNNETWSTGTGQAGKDSAVLPIRDETANGWGTQVAGERGPLGIVGRLAGRLEIAARVGSDVPLFLIGGTVLGLDRGQEVYPLPDVEPTWCVVATPEVGVSTPQAFRDWDALCVKEGLTPEASAGKLNELSRAYASAFAGGILRGGQGAGSSGVLASNNSGREDLAGPQESVLVRTGISSWIQNDFERVVFPQQPSLAEIKRILAGASTPGAASSLVAMLSGSGSALFGLYLAREDAEAACERLRPAGVKSYLTRTLPRAAYWRDMLSH